MAKKETTKKTTKKVDETVEMMEPVSIMEIVEKAEEKKVGKKSAKSKKVDKSPKEKSVDETTDELPSFDVVLGEDYTDEDTAEVPKTEKNADKADETEKAEVYTLAKFREEFKERFGYAPTFNPDQEISKLQLLSYLSAMGCNEVETESVVRDSETKMSAA